jgi:DNA polymerase-3 subunit alpha (Gram-positive type)
LGSVYVIKPENGQFLSQLSPDPILENVKIVQIDVDSANQCWTVWLEGEKRGTEEFWDQLAAQLCAAVGTIDKVTFAWKGNQQHTEDEISYMHSVIKNFNPTAGSREEKQKNPKAKRKKGRRKEQPINTEHVPIASIDVEQNDVVIAGEVVAVDKRTLRTGRILVTFDVWDHTDTITCKLFLELDEEVPPITVGEWLKVKGNVQFQSYEQELALTVQQFNRIPPPPPVEDQAPQKRVELHLHTKMSGLDGVTDVEEVVRQAALWGHPAVAITDHGVVQAFPAACAAGKKHGIKIIYGLEGYLIDNDTDRPHHIVILAKNKTGLKNLYKLVSYSHLHHFYRRPRIPRKLLIDHREGLILGSACEQGEVFQACLRKDPRLKEIARFYDYLEIQPLGNNEFLIGTSLVSSLEDLQEINRTICEVGQELGLPVVATGDVHFLRPEDGVYRTILLQGQGFEDVERPAPLYFRTTDEMLGEFKYLGEELARKVVITDPNKIASQIEELVPIPQGLHAPKIPAAAEQLQEVCYKTARELYGDPLPDLVARRLEKELNAIIGNGYAALYWTARQLVLKSNSDGYMVGSRGSVGSSFVATMSGITEVNPLPPHYICPKCHWHKFFTGEEVGAGIDLPKKDCPRCGTELHRDGFDIPFEVFLGFDGDKVPDIDLNFSGEYQATIQKYTEELFGADYVFRAGTIGTLAEKTAYGFVKNYLEETGQVKRRAEINRMLKKLVGVKRTTGQHPGGMIVVPKDMEIFDFTPIQYPANDPKSGIVTTHFEFSYIHDSLVKLDNLGHKGPTMMRLFEEFSGIRVDDIPMDDPATMAVFCGLESLGVTEEQIGTSIGTLGVPEFGTDFTRQVLEDILPTTFADLVAIMGLTHGTDVWLNNAQNLIREKVTDFKNVIACRDDIMTYLMHRGLSASDAFRIMERVRKGQGLSEADITLMKKHQVPDWYIESCFKIKYMFPKAHAVAYAITAYRAAYFKVHKPAAFYATFLSVEIEHVNADIIVAGVERVKAEIAALEAKGTEATAKDADVITVLKTVLEAMARGIKFLPVDLYHSDATRVIPQGNGLLLPLVSLEGVGLNAANAIVEARQEGEFLSIEDLRQRTKISRTVIDALSRHNCLAGMPETNQLSLFG